ncbi:hypothetical protein NEOLEDRAFT_1147110 [Neolentinus lepideus HHB14362 ss-1]|uniref:Uncharacterized protein n=1 Tax=Neolentinus lepideus HHB14362 ss-1 TaxID=1314782 RepID=A0A165TLI0_9AGAM|nr:hypothetical protein NEOLEDRAFT_1147110 [Neolentinus lepideus HHB14362 ss-1]
MSGIGRRVRKLSSDFGKFIGIKPKEENPLFPKGGFHRHPREERVAQLTMAQAIRIKALKEQAAQNSSASADAKVPSSASGKVPFLLRPLEGKLQANAVLAQGQQNIALRELEEAMREASATFDAPPPYRDDGSQRARDVPAHRRTRANSDVSRFAGTAAHHRREAGIQTAGRDATFSQTSFETRFPALENMPSVSPGDGHSTRTASTSNVPGRSRHHPRTSEDTAHGRHYGSVSPVDSRDPPIGHYGRGHPGPPTERQDRATSRQPPTTVYTHTRGHSDNPTHRTAWGAGVASTYEHRRESSRDRTNTGGPVHRSQLSNHKRAPSQERQRTNSQLERDAFLALSGDQVYATVFREIRDGRSSASTQRDGHQEHPRYVNDAHHSRHAQVVEAAAGRPQSQYPQVGYAMLAAPPVPPPQVAQSALGLYNPEPVKPHAAGTSTSTTPPRVSGSRPYAQHGASHTTYAPPTTVQKASEHAYAAQTAARNVPVPAQQRGRRDDGPPTTSFVPVTVQSASAGVRPPATADKGKKPERHAPQPEARPSRVPSPKPFPREPPSPGYYYEDESEGGYEDEAERTAKVQEKCTNWMAENAAYQQEQLRLQRAEEKLRRQRAEEQLRQQREAQLRQQQVEDRRDPKLIQELSNILRDPFAEDTQARARSSDARRAASPSQTHHASTSARQYQLQQASSSRAHGQHYATPDSKGEHKDYRSGRH